MREKLKTLGYALVSLLCIGLIVWSVFADFTGFGRSKTDWERDQEIKREAQYDAGYEDGFDQGHREGYEDGEDEGWRNGYEEGYREGSQYGWKDNIGEVADHFSGGAVDYAIEHGGMHPEDAASIIENGGTKSEYEAASRTLYYFFMYFFDAMYH